MGFCTAAPARTDKCLGAQTPRMSYEDWKKKQKEAEGKLAMVAENEEKKSRK